MNQCKGKSLHLINDLADKMCVCVSYHLVQVQLFQQGNWMAKEQTAIQNWGESEMKQEDSQAATGWEG